MTVARVDEIYERYIRPLTPSERLRILERTAHDLVKYSDPVTNRPVYSILELRGLGKHIWMGVDAKQYIDEMRDEWDKEP